MPNKSSIADFIVAWEKMTTNVTINAAELPPHLALYNEPLVELLQEFKAIGAAKDARRAVKQQEVKDSDELKKRGRKLAENLRLALIAHHGSDSKLLLRYGIPPRRARKRKQTDSQGPPQPENPESQPEAKPAPQAGGSSAPAASVTGGRAVSQAAEQPKPETPAPAPQSNPAPKTA